MKYYMGYTKRGMYRHLLPAKVIDDMLANQPISDPISNILYDKCIPKIPAHSAICGVTAIATAFNIRTKKLIKFDYHWMTDSICRNCLGKFYDARDS